MDRKIGERQRWAWLASGLSVTVAACACGLNWVWVLLGGSTVMLYYINIDRNLPSRGLAALLTKAFGKAGKILAALTLLWTVVTMAWAANLADGAFPMVDGLPMLGWSMLALAAWGSGKGAGACTRCAGVLCLFLLALYGVVAAFAVPDVDPQYLLPKGSWKDAILTVGIFLMPASVWYVPCTRSRKRPAWEMALALPLFAAILAAIATGMLSPALARSLPSPLYTVAQSVSVFGVVERIEPLLSSAMTMGVFCLLSAMACACRGLWGQIRPWKWGGAVCCGAAGILMKWIGETELILLAAGAMIFWGVLPAVTMFVVSRKGKWSRNGG